MIITAFWQPAEADGEASSICPKKREGLWNLEELGHRLSDTTQAYSVDKYMGSTVLMVHGL